MLDKIWLEVYTDGEAVSEVGETVKVDSEVYGTTVVKVVLADVRISVLDKTMLEVYTDGVASLVGIW